MTFTFSCSSFTSLFWPRTPSSVCASPVWDWPLSCAERCGCRVHYQQWNRHYYHYCWCSDCSSLLRPLHHPCCCSCPPPVLLLLHLHPSEEVHYPAVAHPSLHSDLRRSPAQGRSWWRSDRRWSCQAGRFHRRRWTKWRCLRSVCPRSCCSDTCWWSGSAPAGSGGLTGHYRMWTDDSDWLFVPRWSSRAFYCSPVMWHNRWVPTGHCGRSDSLCLCQSLKCPCAPLQSHFLQYCLHLPHHWCPFLCLSLWACRCAAPANFPLHSESGSFLDWDLRRGRSWRNHW